jgi:hypothetical protein
LGEKQEEDLEGGGTDNRAFVKEARGSTFVSISISESTLVCFITPPTSSPGVTDPSAEYSSSVEGNAIFSGVVELRGAGDNIIPKLVSLTGDKNWLNIADTARSLALTAA